MNTRSDRHRRERTVSVLFIVILILSGAGYMRSGTGIENAPYLPTPLETPPFEYILNKNVFEFLNLELIECEENSVTDYENWFDYFMDWPAITYHNGGVNDAIRGYLPPPSGIDEVITVIGDARFHLYMIIYGEEKTIAFYGSPPNRFDVVLHPRILMIMDYHTFQPEMILDFKTYTHSSGDLEADSGFVFQGLKWAEAEQGILYVSTAHRTYASSSGGLNAYITAIDLETLEFLWRSQPLVSNSDNFLIEGDAIITGYGFTNEDDRIYLLNRITGEVMDSYPVPSAPRYFHRDEDFLYVRCYSSDCIFSISR